MQEESLLASIGALVWGAASAQIVRPIRIDKAFCGGLRSGFEVGLAVTIMYEQVLDTLSSQHEIITACWHPCELWIVY